MYPSDQQVKRSLRSLREPQPLLLISRQHGPFSNRSERLFRPLLSASETPTGATEAAQLTSQSPHSPPKKEKE